MLNIFRTRMPWLVTIMVTLAIAGCGGTDDEAATTTTTGGSTTSTTAGPTTSSSSGISTTTGDQGSRLSESYFETATSGSVFGTPEARG